MDTETVVRSISCKVSPVINGSSVMFLYQGKADTVFLTGDYNRWELKDRMIPLLDGQDRRLGSSGDERNTVWAIEKTFPANSRFDYKFIVDGSWITDPWNNTTNMVGPNRNSTLIMPEYRSEYEAIIGTEVPRGTVIRNLEYKSKSMGARMRYHVYLPFGYAEKKPNRILYALDGSDYLNFSNIPLVLDYLIHTGGIPAVAAILADPQERSRDYTIYEPYLDYILEELSPFAEESYLDRTRKPERSVIGVSWGGLTAISIAVAAQGGFRSVLSQSGSFWPGDFLVFDLLRDHGPPGIRFCLQTGTIEDTEEMNNAMKELLVGKGYSVDYEKYAETHSWTNWRGHLDEGLKKLFV